MDDQGKEGSGPSIGDPDPTARSPASSVGTDDLGGGVRVIDWRPRPQIDWGPSIRVPGRFGSSVPMEDAGDLVGGIGDPDPDPELTGESPTTPGPIRSKTVSSVRPGSLLPDSSSSDPQLLRMALTPLAAKVHWLRGNFLRPLQFFAMASMPRWVRWRGSLVSKYIQAFGPQKANLVVDEL
ncbi:hypothetical protein CRG98_033691 [Punica granatum]|uniref:Uncharacterized protein n=1 Tax=Punica granatum TaxID=22663 RepID=A0A2I0IPI1_PUNGR|nr:hypothetical protein CRG98_033691 [Punica granatum]